MSAPRTMGVVGVALALVGALLVAFSGEKGSQVDPGTPAVVNSDRPGINAHNSPAVAADPRDPATIAVADRIDTPRFSCSVSLSTNGGLNWRTLDLPRAPEAPNCFWPDVAFDDQGRLLVLYTATGGRYNQPLGVWLQRYAGERADGPPTRVAGTEAFHAHFAVDGRTVLVVYVQTPPENADRPLGFEPGAHPILIARSEDGGATFGVPDAVSGPGERVAHPTVLFGDGGQVVVGALDYGDDVENYEATHQGQAGPPPDARWRVVVWRSTDRGAHFGPAVPVTDGLPAPQRVVIDLAPGPSFAADPARNRLYASWEAGVGDGRDVFVARSDDFGATWLPPTRLAPTAKSQLLPAVGVAVAADGRVDVVFYDRSEDPDDVLAEVVVGSSWDGGATFRTAEASSAAFDTRIGLGSPQGVPQLGNQLAVLSQPDRFLAFWADTSQGTIDTNLQDLAVVSVDVRKPGGRWWVLLVPGVLLLGAGAGVLAVSWRRARARRRPSPGPAPPR